MKKTVAIVGAGIAGCVIGYELARRNWKVIILEREKQVGGLARTFRYGDHAFDIGPHRFNIQEKENGAFIKKILSADLRIIERNSKVYFNKKYYSWPFRKTNLCSFPIKLAISSCYELIHALTKPTKRTEESFMDYIVHNYGRTLYHVFFKDYTEKFFGYPAQNIHSDWAKDSVEKAVIEKHVQAQNLMDIFKLTIKSKCFKMKFAYTEKGIGLFCEKLAQEILKYGGEIHLNSPVTHLMRSSDNIKNVLCNNKIFEADKIVWSGSLKNLCSLSGLPEPGIHYRSLILYNIVTKSPLKQDFQWCYYGNNEIYNRVSIPSLFNNNMSPTKKTSLCVEVTASEEDKHWKDPEILIKRIKNDLLKVKLIQNNDKLERVYVEKISDAYPIYTIGYDQKLLKIRSQLSVFKNLILSGRTGLFWYNNMDDSVKNGLDTAQKLISEKYESPSIR